MKLLRLALAQLFDEIEVLMDEEALFQMGRGGKGSKSEINMHRSFRMASNGWVIV